MGRIEIGTVGIPPSSEQLKIRSLPETVIMNFAKVCNLWCTHCFYPQMATKREQSANKNNEKYLPVDTFQKVVDEIASWENSVVLRIASDGEPLIHPQCINMVSYAKKNNVIVALTTNGILLSPKTIANLLETQIDVIDISIDAATSTSYGKVRQSRSFFNFYEKVEKNVRNLIELKNKFAPQSKTKIMVNMIDQPMVHEEISLFQKKWSEWGVDAVLIRPFHSTSNLTMQEGIVTTVSGVDRFPCKYPFTRLNVGFDNEGHPIVYYCSHDWEEKTIVGVLGIDGNLQTIWQGTKMNEIRRRHLENDYPSNSFCGSCPDWYLGWGKSHHQLVQTIR